jgi:ApbE superfamily uncharacterized protein (UPF0280 family)
LLLPEKRFYRALQKPKGFVSFNLVSGESDVWIAVPEGSFRGELKKELLNYLILIREQIKSFIEKFPEFYRSLTPVKVPLLSPEIVREMADASEVVGVGPMAGVAGAVSLFLGRRIESFGLEEYIVENGGDIYLSLKRRTVVSIFTREPKLSGKLGVELKPGKWGISSSSSKFGHSLSLGNVQIATVIGKNPIVTDCSATYLGNSRSIEEAKRRSEELLRFNTGCISLIEGKFVISGEVSLVKLD